MKRDRKGWTPGKIIPTEDGFYLIITRPTPIPSNILGCKPITFNPQMELVQKFPSQKGHYKNFWGFYNRKVEWWIKCPEIPTNIKGSKYLGGGGY